MFRKLTLALAATAALGFAALSPTAASAGGGGWKHKHHHWKGPHWSYGIGFYGPTFASGGDCYYVRKVTYTPYGKRFRRVLVCD